MAGAKHRSIGVALCSLAERFLLPSPLRLAGGPDSLVFKCSWQISACLLISVARFTSCLMIQDSFFRHPDWNQDTSTKETTTAQWNNAVQFVIVWIMVIVAPRVPLWFAPSNLQREREGTEEEREMEEGRESKRKIPGRYTTYILLNM